MAKIVFVVLHFQAIEETHKCIKSIKRNVGTENYFIIIIDNKSPDDSGKELKKKYFYDEKIKIILAEENMGFAKGNNIGFLWAKDHINPDYIVVSNNDIQIMTKQFYECVCNEYIKSEFAVLGPLILTADGHYNSNPMRDEMISRETILHDLKDAKFHLKLNRLNLLNFYNLLHTLKSLLRRTKPKKNISSEYCEGCTLHGSFLIFSKRFMNEFSGLDPRTFMYKEEYILHAKVQMKGLKMVYTPALFVYHEEDASTNTVLKKSKEKFNFIYKNLIESSKVLLDVYDELGIK